MGSDLSNQNMMKKLGIGFTQETAVGCKYSTVSPYQPLGNTLPSTRVHYVLCSNGFYFLSDIESNKSKCCPALPGAWVPANAATHAESFLFILTIIQNPFRG